MKDYQNFDFKLGEVAQFLSNCAGEFRDFTAKFDEQWQKEYRHIIGKTVYEITEFRTKLYEKYPNLTHDFVKENKENRERADMLGKINTEAQILFHAKDFAKAKEKFEELLQKSEFGYYKLEAEIMLYECEHRIKKDLDEMKIKTYQTYEKLDKIYQKGLKFENEKEFTKAIEIYENLLKTSKFSEFENKAMAGLYRCEKALNLY